MEITGMVNNACRERLIAALEALDGVHEVNVSLIKAQAVVIHAESCRPRTLLRTIAAAGFSASTVDGGMEAA